MLGLKQRLSQEGGGTTCYVDSIRRTTEYEYVIASKIRTLIRADNLFSSIETSKVGVKNALLSKMW